MKHKFLLLYSWFVRIFLFPLPDIPFIMRFRGFLYGIFMKECGKNFQVAHNVIINSLESISVEENIYIAPNSFIIGGDKINIKKNVQIGPGCVFSSTSHKYDTLKKAFLKERLNKGGIDIGSGVWFAANCTVAAGSNVPDGCVVGANSFVNKNLKKKYSIYGGVPVKFIKEIENNND